MVAWAQDWEWEVTANRKKGTPGGDGAVLKLDCGKGCTTVYIYKDALDCALTTGKLCYVNYTS